MCIYLIKCYFYFALFSFWLWKNIDWIKFLSYCGLSFIICPFECFYVNLNLPLPLPLFFPFSPSLSVSLSLSLSSLSLSFLSLSLSLPPHSVSVLPTAPPSHLLYFLLFICFSLLLPFVPPSCLSFHLCLSLNRAKNLAGKYHEGKEGAYMCLNEKWKIKSLILTEFLVL